MTRDELRTHFDLKPCPNPKHLFKVGRLMGEWRWARDAWSQLVGETMQTLHLALHTTHAVDGTTIHSITIWKLKVIWGILK